MTRLIRYQSLHFLLEGFYWYHFLLFQLIQLNVGFSEKQQNNDCSVSSPPQNQIFFLQNYLHIQLRQKHLFSQFQ